AARVVGRARRARGLAAAPRTARSGAPRIVVRRARRHGRPDRRPLTATRRRRSAGGGGTLGWSEESVVGGIAAEAGEVDLHAAHAAALREDARLRLDALGDEHRCRRREARVALETLAVPEQLLHTCDLADALHL